MSDTALKPRTEIKVERPRLYKVILLNDDFTPKEFVIAVLKAEFSMTEDQARKAWGGALEGEAGEGCHYLNPAWEKAPSYFAFMFDGGKFVRYDVGNDKEIAPGGGRRGMSEAEIGAAYPGRVAKAPHKYVDGGKYLRIKADDGSDGVLVFETDAAGKVSEWHAGLAPQVDWIEGCS